LAKHIPALSNDRVHVIKTPGKTVKLLRRVSGVAGLWEELTIFLKEARVLFHRRLPEGDFETMKKICVSP
jgi:hypothetical protein